MRFIATYEDALPSAACSKIINAAQGADAVQGQIGAGLVPNVKRSVDCDIEDILPDMQQGLRENLWTHVTMYVHSHPHLVTGTVAPVLPDGRPMTSEILRSLRFATVTRICKAVFALGQLNVQHYATGKGNFSHWHSEISPSPNSIAPLHRILFAIYYLNTVEIGGHTEFAAQKFSLSPRVGRLLIAPAGFTHTHRGLVPTSNDKWILTTWVSFRPASELNMTRVSAIA